LKAMHRYQSVWQCAETNRKVEVEVRYSMADSGVSISEVTPKRVTFLCPETKSELRSIGVWTEAGRRHLVSVLHTAGHIDLLPEEIAASHNMDTSA
jgi:hypothetical protein